MGIIDPGPRNKGDNYMKKFVISAILSIVMFAGGYAVAGNFMHCKCGQACACAHCNCNK